MDRLSPSEVSAQIRAVQEAARAKDYSLAFSLEVTVWHDVLEAIADGAWDGQDLAKAALGTLSIKFPRQVAD